MCVIESVSIKLCRSIPPVINYNKAFVSRHVRKYIIEVCTVIVACFYTLNMSCEIQQSYVADIINIEIIKCDYFLQAIWLNLGNNHSSLVFVRCVMFLSLFCSPMH